MPKNNDLGITVFGLIMLLIFGGGFIAKRLGGDQEGAPKGGSSSKVMDPDITFEDPYGMKQGAGLLREFCASITVTQEGHAAWSGSSVEWSLKLPNGQVFDRPDRGEFSDAEGPFELRSDLCWTFENAIEPGDYEVRYKNPETGAKTTGTLTVVPS